MIERVTPTAECAAHIFLRRFEAPIRSQRGIDVAFWRQNGDQSCVPAWWPLYLDSIRDSTSNKSSREKGWMMSGRGKLPARLHKTTRPIHLPHRNLAYSSSRNQGTSIAALPDISEDGRPYGASQDEILQDQEAEMPDEVQSDVMFSPFGEKSPTQVEEQSNKYDESWTNFVRTGWKQERASTVLRLLSRSDNPIDLNRALTAFNAISQSQRTGRDYRKAVEIATRQHRYSMAIQLIKEGLSQNGGVEIFFQFLAHCVKNVLWGTAADLWNQVGRPQIRVLRNATRDQDSKSFNFAGRFTSYFEEIEDLPLRVATLSERLCDSDAVLMSRKPDLVDLCRNLCFTIVESQQIMMSITGAGLLSILSIPTSLGFDSSLHFAALGTICKMPERGVKSQLAVLIYRNYKFKFADANIPKWVFGAMIGICSQGNHGSATYLALLEDYKSIHGTPDGLTYSQLMRACANQGESADLQFIFDDFCQHNRPSSISDIYPLIRVHAVLGQSEKAQSVFDTLPARFGLEVDARTWNALLLSYARSNDSKRTFDVFQKMTRSNVRPDQYSWTILVSVASKKGDSEHARELLLQAEKAGISPPTAMIGALVDSCLLNDQIEEAERLVIKATGMKLGDSPTRLWNSLFRYHAFKANSESILRTQKLMKEFNVRPDSMTYGALMTALVVQRRTQEAAKILRTLHFSQSLSATQFHYSILIHGFALEGKYEAGLVVYQELVDRFPQPTLSARLTKLRMITERAVNSNSIRGYDSQKVLMELLKSLRTTFDQIRPSDLASTTPNPGFSRRAARTDTEPMFLQSLVQFVQRSGAADVAQDILSSIANSNNTLLRNIPSTDVSWSNSLHRGSIELDLAVKREDWSETERCWNHILGLVLQNCSSTTKDEESVPDSLPTVSSQANLSENDDTVQFKSMIAPKIKVSESKTTTAKDGKTAQSQNTTFRKTVAKVLPAHRFILSRQISQYILALDKQNLHERLPDWIPQLYEHGLELDSKNWNSLLQALCRSAELKDRMMAFELFEKHLMPHTPSWTVIRRGKWIVPSEEALTTKGQFQLDGRQSRKFLERTTPGLLMPSYFTMIHLAMALMKSTQTKSTDSAVFVSKLREVAPQTLRFVRNTPYLRDRVQGVLLRGLQVIGDLPKRPRQSNISTVFKGIKSSQSALDNVPSEAREYIEGLISPRDDIRGLNKEFHQREYDSLSTTQMEKAKEYLEDTDPMPLFLPHKGRLETQEEADERVLREDRRKTEIIQNLVLEARRRSPMMVTASSGDPQAGAITLAPSSRSSPVVAPESDEEWLAKFKELAHLARRVRRRRVTNLGAKSARVSRRLPDSSQLTQRRRSRVLFVDTPTQETPQLINTSSRSFSKNKAYRALRMSRRSRKSRVRLKQLLLSSPAPLKILPKTLHVKKF